MCSWGRLSSETDSRGCTWFPCHHSPEERRICEDRPACWPVISSWHHTEYYQSHVTLCVHNIWECLGHVPVLFVWGRLWQVHVELFFSQSVNILTLFCQQKQYPAWKPCSCRLWRFLAGFVNLTKSTIGGKLFQFRFICKCESFLNIHFNSACVHVNHISTQHVQYWQCIMAIA